MKRKLIWGNYSFQRWISYLYETKGSTVLNQSPSLEVLVVAPSVGVWPGGLTQVNLTFKNKSKPAVRACSARALTDQLRQEACTSLCSSPLCRPTQRPPHLPPMLFLWDSYGET